MGENGLLYKQMENMRNHRINDSERAAEYQRNLNTEVNFSGKSFRSNIIETTCSEIKLSLFSFYLP